MGKYKPSKLTPKAAAQSNALLALLFGALLSYVAAEIVLATRRHPYHWGPALAGGTLAVAVVHGVAGRGPAGVVVQHGSRNCAGMREWPFGGRRNVGRDRRGVRGQAELIGSQGDGGAS